MKSNFYSLGYTLVADQGSTFRPEFRPPSNYRKEETVREWMVEREAKWTGEEAPRTPLAGKVGYWVLRSVPVDWSPKFAAPEIVAQGASSDSLLETLNNLLLGTAIYRDVRTSTRYPYFAGADLDVEGTIIGFNVRDVLRIAGWSATQAHPLLLLHRANPNTFLDPRSFLHLSDSSMFGIRELAIHVAKYPFEQHMAECPTGGKTESTANIADYHSVLSLRLAHIGLTACGFGQPFAAPIGEPGASAYPILPLPC